VAIVPEALERYAEEHTTSPPPFLAELAKETRALPSSGMLTGTVEGRLLELLVRCTGARRVLEIGTFTGYSALSMAAGLPPGGRIVTCEHDPDRAAVARRYIEASPYADLIELRLGPALETIGRLSGPFDLVFIDADKENYTNYFEAALRLLADDGLIVADNTLWDGRVIDEGDASDSTEAIRAFNDHVRNDPRVVCTLLTVRDGVTLIRKA
jgi:caffeoyl-CoA O-methyltransferase